MENQIESHLSDKRAEEIKSLARSHAELAIGVLVDVMADEDAKAAARVKAADIILQRGFGAPERRVEQRVDVTIYDERKAHLSALQELAARRQITSTPSPIVDAEFEDVTPEKVEKPPSTGQG